MGRANLKEVPMERDCQSLATRVQAKKKFQGGQMEGGGAQPPLKSTYLRKPSYIVIENNLLGKARLLPPQSPFKRGKTQPAQLLPGLSLSMEL